MISELIEKQLKKVEKADLSNFDEATNTFYIPQRKDIKIEIDKCYLIHLLPSVFTNSALRDNWNSGSVPPTSYIKAEVTKIMPNMIKVVGIGFNLDTNTTTQSFWSGWLSMPDIEIVEKL